MGAKILIVDETPANLVALQAVLAPLDVCVASGEEALMQVLSSAFAVILLDVKLPGIDGFETAALIRQRELSREIPLLFLTGYDDAALNMQRAYDVGGFDLLPSPSIPTFCDTRSLASCAATNKPRS